MAINAIKARHGSMRKKNPLTDRKPPVLPTSIEEVDMPEPGQQYGYQGPPPQQGGSMYPLPRGGPVPPLNTNFIRTDNPPIPSSWIRGEP